MVLLLQAAFLPRLVYFLRTSPLLDVSILNSFDDHLRDAFQSIFNIKLDQKNWLQGTLPICVGGLGLGSAAELAPSAFLASAAATVALQDLMLPRDVIYVDNFRLQVYDMWRGDVVALENPSQKHWIAPCLNRSVDRWLQLNGSAFDKARIMAEDKPDIRLSTNTWYDVFKRAGIPVIKEPMGLIEEGAFRPDGYTITPWAQGRRPKILLNLEEIVLICSAQDKLSEIIRPKNFVL
ncbi:hypothetical protein HELRODRAFT_160967 [Helobdella robusta]|uniref:Uncharacterized protein n=1 Tax=Helobdella robusta TaxID=6412 RepID=T1EQX7_HELRO|nr:hypothetical protein HELRODRAFT_160967 [Helobdella robusta]ESO01800.1 hypothetical protein HELRODRAFT_160967 [Helobdella robusta]